MYNLRSRGKGDDSRQPDTRMKKAKLNSEFEAAQTLTSLTSLAHPSQQVEKDGSNPSDEEANLSMQDPGANVVISPPAKEQTTYRPHPSRKIAHQFFHPTSHTLSFEDAQSKLTDREARRMRRVLANREAARKTIRRRQIVYDELAKKAEALELENANLKKQKEEKIRDYRTLKKTNDNLKKMMVEFKLPENPEQATKEQQPTATEEQPPPALTQVPVPPSWHSLIQSSLQQFSSQNVAPPVIPVPESLRQCPLNSPGTSSSSIPAPGGGAFMYVLQVVPSEEHSESSNQNQAHVCNQCGAPAAGQPSTPVINRGSLGKTVSDIVETSSASGGGIVNVSLQLRSFSEEIVVSDTKARATVAGRVNVNLQRQSSSEEAAVSDIKVRTVNILRNCNPDTKECLMEAGPPATPAQARKRRRELTKLKNLRLGQYTMN